MADTPNPSLFTIAGLAHRCRQETDLFFRRLENDERYCFELFRRAIETKNEQAWNLKPTSVKRHSMIILLRVKLSPTLTTEQMRSP